MRNLKFLSLLLLAGSLTACHDYSATNNPPHPRTNEPEYAAAMNGEQFAAKVAASDKFEIASSRLALKRSKNSNVREIARHLIADHTNSGAKLKTILVADGMPAPSSTLNPMQQHRLDSLRHSTNFDADYLQSQERVHHHAIQMFDNYARSGDNDDLRRFASETLPTLHQHERMIEQAE